MINEKDAEFKNRINNFEKGFINALPNDIHKQNLRLLLKDKWKIIANYVKNEYEWICSNCKTNMIENKKNLHAHEMWFLDYDNKTAELTEIIPLCNYCHMYYHQGLYEIQRHNNTITDDKALIIEEHWKKYCSGGYKYKSTKFDINKINFKETFINNEWTIKTVDNNITKKDKWIIKPFDDIINKYDILINKKNGQFNITDYIINKE